MALSVPFKQSPNYSQGRGGQQIKGVCIHTMAGTYNGSISWFLNSGSQASSHYLVSLKGEITQMVNLADMAWTNGIKWKSGVPYTSTDRQLDINRLAPIVRDNKNINPNQYTVTIELEGYPNDPVTTEMYDAVLKILRHVRDTYGIKFSRYNLIGHFEVDYINKPSCPGPRFNFDHVLNTLNNGANAPTPQPQHQLPNNFSEEAYLELNPDVKDAVTKKVFASGAAHYLWVLKNNPEEAARRKYSQEDLNKLKQQQIDMALQEDLNRLNGVVNELQNQVTNQNQAIISLTELKKADESKIVTLTNEKEELSIRLQDAIKGIEEQKTSYESQITQLKTTYETQISGLNTTITELSGRLDVAIKTIEEQRIEISGLNKAIADYKSGKESDTYLMTHEAAKKLEQIVVSDSSWKDKLLHIWKEILLIIINWGTPAALVMFAMFEGWLKGINESTVIGGFALGSGAAIVKVIGQALTSKGTVLVKAKADEEKEKLVKELATQ